MPNPFTLSLNASAEEIGIAAWCALKAAAWGIYTAQLLTASALGVDLQTLDAATRLKWKRQIFAYVAGQLEEGPFRRELERYADTLGNDDEPRLPSFSN